MIITMREQNEHIELGYVDIPRDYLGFTVKQKKAVCTKIIDVLLLHIDKELDPEINRISFLDDVLESSLETNEQHEEYVVCQVLYDCRKMINE